MDLLIAVLYQPFLNLLVFFYWLLTLTPFGADMGIAVILLTISIRILLLPITLAGHRSEAERREIEEKVKQVKELHQHSPLEQEAAVKKILRANPRILFSEAFMFLIQLVISLILWRIFSHGLSGEDLHYLYKFMPDVPQPYELSFLGRYDLTHPDWHLNVVQTIMIFILETVSIILSPYKISQQEVVRFQLVLPLVSFGIFAFLPAGKKLFVITTLVFSLAVILIRAFVEWFQRTFPPPPEEEEEASPDSLTVPVRPVQ